MHPSMLQRPKPTEQKPPAYEHQIQPPQQTDPYHTINQLTLRIQELQLQRQQLTLQTQQQAARQHDQTKQHNMAYQVNMPNDIRNSARQQPNQPYLYRRQTTYPDDEEPASKRPEMPQRPRSATRRPIGSNPIRRRSAMDYTQPKEPEDTYTDEEELNCMSRTDNLTESEV